MKMMAQKKAEEEEKKPTGGEDDKKTEESKPAAETATSPARWDFNRYYSIVIIQERLHFLFLISTPFWAKPSKEIEITTNKSTTMCLKYGQYAA